MEERKDWNIRRKIVNHPFNAEIMDRIIKTMICGQNKSPINAVLIWPRQPIAVSDISIYIRLIDIRDGSSKPVYGGVGRLMIGTYSYTYLWYTM